MLYNRAQKGTTVCIIVASLISFALTGCGIPSDAWGLWWSANQRFGPLTKAENSLFVTSAIGSIAVCYDDGEDNDPNNAHLWHKDRTIRAECIEWLCISPESSKHVTQEGIMVEGARIDGVLNLGFRKIPFPLVFIKSSFKDTIYLYSTEIQALDLTGTHTRSIKADGLMVDEWLFLRNGFEAHGEVRLTQATIRGSLECDGSQFINPGGTALDGEGINVLGNVFLRDKFKAEGEVRLSGATIGGQLNCIAGQFINPEGFSLLASGLKVEGDVLLNYGFRAEGAVHIQKATIEGDLICSDGHFINPKGFSFYADGMNVRNNVLFNNGFRAKGMVSISGATITGNLDCSDGKFIDPNSTAIYASNIQINNDVIMSQDFFAEGEVNLQGATIGGMLSSNKGKFINPRGYALLAFGLKTASVIFINVESEGHVMLDSGLISSHLICRGGKFSNPGGEALSASSMRIEGSVLLGEGFEAKGSVILSYAKIGGGIYCNNSSFNGI